MQVRPPTAKEKAQFESNANAAKQAALAGQRAQGQFDNSIAFNKANPGVGPSFTVPSPAQPQSQDSSNIFGDIAGGIGSLFGDVGGGIGDILGGIFGGNSGSSGGSSAFGPALQSLLGLINKNDASGGRQDAIDNLSESPIMQELRALRGQVGVRADADFEELQGFDKEAATDRNINDLFGIARPDLETRAGQVMSQDFLGGTLGLDLGGRGSPLQQAFSKNLGQAVNSANLQGRQMALTEQGQLNTLFTNDINTIRKLAEPETDIQNLNYSNDLSSAEEDNNSLQGILGLISSLLQGGKNEPDKDGTITPPTIPPGIEKVIKELIPTGAASPLLDQFGDVTGNTGGLPTIPNFQPSTGDLGGTGLPSGFRVAIDSGVINPADALSLSTLFDGVEGTLGGLSGPLTEFGGGSTFGIGDPGGFGDTINTLGELTGNVPTSLPSNFDFSGAGMDPSDIGGLRDISSAADSAIKASTATDKFLAGLAEKARGIIDGAGSLFKGTSVALEGGGMTSAFAASPAFGALMGIGGPMLIGLLAGGFGQSPGGAINQLTGKATFNGDPIPVPSTAKGNTNGYKALEGTLAIVDNTGKVLSFKKGNKEDAGFDANSQQTVWIPSPVTGPQMVTFASGGRAQVHIPNNLIANIQASEDARRTGGADYAPGNSEGLSLIDYFGGGGAAPPYDPGEGGQ
jgi:hypothetical protein